MAIDTGSGGFVHHVCLYGSDEQFLDTAVPFLKEGLTGGSPVLAVTTPYNLGLLKDALGELAERMHSGDSAYFGRRSVDRVAAFLSHYQRHRVPGRRMRMLAEPVWHGKSPRQIAEWKRMEAGLTELLADAEVDMVCPYDIRSVPADVLLAARVTHPTVLDGTRQQPSVEFPGARAAAERYPPPAERPTAAAAVLGPTRDLGALRRFAREQAAAAGLDAEGAARAELALHEAAGYLMDGAGLRVEAWREPGALVWQLYRAGLEGAGPSPFSGLLPPGAAAGPEDGLWLARNLAESLDLRTEPRGVTLRLRISDAWAVEHH
ncbi:sensor histidine kinase [Streptomyces sp. A7024]|uniref:Sensor histidine kinase n=1 Tax=Streptomyces coryli TaxID=1128680 RepID=A0A6G4U8M2_9ACTN|nr:sensor histidine kinase [Streptomyces coryli]NGN68352.1 sensor histidine kinase [Streptomyces coryli]